MDCGGTAADLLQFHSLNFQTFACIMSLLLCWFLFRLVVCTCLQAMCSQGMDLYVKFPSIALRCKEDVELSRYNDIRQMNM